MPADVDGVDLFVSLTTVYETTWGCSRSGEELTVFVHRWTATELAQLGFAQADGG